jgi:trk system potassium uptake protein TrkA
MKKQVIVIGLGQFGLAIASSLAARGVEVLAIDAELELVEAAAPFVTEAVCFDATDEKALMRAAPEARDACVVAIGDRSRDASIIATALLKQLGARRVVARANNDIHARILRLVGADQVVNPQREFGERFASRILHQNVLGAMSLGEDLVISELIAPESFVGQTIAALALPKRFGVTIVALRHANRGRILTPEPDERIRSGDMLVVVSREGAVADLVERS